MQEQQKGMAIASMVLGITSLVLFFFFGFILAVIAIVLGHIHLSNMKKEPEQYTGRGMAVAGLATGYVSIGFVVLGLVIAGGAAALFGIFS
jgi:hypothetical protein